MKQAGLVLWKDVRQLSPQLGLYAVLLAVFACAVPQTWPGSAPNSFLAVFVTMLKLLIGLSQFVLITSVVHADRLVGEEQFWITRPYDWRSLLGAKLLFVVTCVALPLVAMQWCLLCGAGLNPFVAKAGMASMFLRFALAAWLPLMVIAAVTDSMATAFAFLAVLLVAWAGTLQFILSGTDSRMSPPDEFALFGPFFGVMLLAILAYQYALRRTRHARVAIAATLALFLLFTFGVDRQGFGEPVKAMIRNDYAIPPNGSPALVFADGPVPYEERGQDLQYLRHVVEVKLPVHIQGLPSDAKIHEPNIAVAFATNGMRYAGPWQNASVSENAIGFPLPKGIFDQIAGVKIALHLELIAELITPTQAQHVVAADRFPGPMNGNCILASGRVTCRSAYEAWTPTRVEAFGLCHGESPGAVEAKLLQVPPGTKADPVVNEALALQGRVCTGDTLTFTEYGSSQRIRLILDVPNLRLRDYRARE